MDEWIESYGKLELSPSTMLSYKKKIKLHIKPDLGKNKINALSHEQLQKFLQKKFDEGFSRNTLSIMKSILNNSLSYAVFPLKYLNANPASNLKMPSKNAIPKNPTRTKIRYVIPKDKLDLILDRFPEGTTAHIPICLGYYCGLRHGEAFAIDIDNDIDFEKGILHLRHQLQSIDGFWTLINPKYNSIRDIDLNEKMLDLLKREKEIQIANKEKYREYYKQLKINDKGQLNYENGTNIQLVTMRENGEFLSPRIIQHVGRVVHYEKGLEYKEFDFHSLRHTHTTMLLANGADIKYVQKRLGHKNIKVTLDIYYQLTDDIREKNKKFIEML